MTLLSYPLTHQGMVRDHNEDALVTKHFARPDGREFDLLAVADGMGGHSRGEVASRIALDTLVEYLVFAAWTDPALALDAALQLANARVHEAGGGMGTTLVAVLLDAKSSTYWTANVGDSRAYVLTAGRLQALTSDHSAVAARVEAGLMTREESEVASGRNVLLRAIGPDPEVEVDVFPPRQLRPGERLLICSDGLHSMVRERDLAKLAWSSSLTTVAPTLIDAANRAGGRDNISVIVAALESTEATIAELGSLPPAQPIHRQLALAGAAAVLGAAMFGGAVVVWLVGRDGTDSAAVEAKETSSPPISATSSPPPSATPTRTRVASSPASAGPSGLTSSTFTPTPVPPTSTPVPPTSTPTPTPRPPTPTPVPTSTPAPTATHTATPSVVPCPTATPGSEQLTIDCIATATASVSPTQAASPTPTALLKPATTTSPTATDSSNGAPQSQFAVASLGVNLRRLWNALGRP